MEIQRHEAKKLREGKGLVSTSALKNIRNVAMDVLDTHSADRHLNYLKTPSTPECCSMHQKLHSFSGL